MIRDGVRLTAIGVVLGLGAAYATTRVLSAVLYGISATDLVTFAGVTVVLVSIAFLSSYIPARRASNLDPMTALHHE